MMVKQFIIVLAASTLLSCSEEDGGFERSDPKTPAEEKPLELPKVKIATADNGRNIFEPMQFTVYIEGSEDSDPYGLFYGFRLRDCYDSLVWRIPALDASFRFYEPGRWYGTWANCFFSSGEWDTQLSGYRNGEAVYSYDYPVTVNSDKDFLCYDWAEVTEDSRGSLGYNDVFAPEDQGWHFATYQTIHGGVPSTTLFCFPEGGNPLLETEERRLLFDLICNLYGEPAYGEDDPETEVRYNESFHYKRAGVQPLYIWITDSSRMALLRDDEEFPTLPYSVYAEPIHF